MAKVRFWRRKPLPAIPPFQPIPLDFKPLEPKDPDMIVTESELTQTGMWRLFPWKKPKG